MADVPEPEPPLPVPRWACLTVLLLAEAGALSLGFDAAVRSGDPGWAGAVVAWSPAVARWCLVAAVAAVALVGWLYRPALYAAASARHPVRDVVLAVGGQLVAYATFVWCTVRVAGVATTPTDWDVLGWVTSGWLTVSLWLIALLPPRAWVVLIRQARWAVLLAAAIATIASLVARAAREEWDVLSGPTMWAAHKLLRAVVSVPVYVPSERLLGTQTFYVEVGAPCSGYEGLGLMAVYLTAYLILFRRDLRFPRAFLLLPLGLVAVWVANVVRLVALILIGTWVSPALAMGGFHSQAGWVGFNAVAVGILLLVHHFGVFARERWATAGSPSATVAYLTPLLGTVAVGMLAAAVISDPTSLYPLRALTGAILLWYFWPRFACLRVAGTASAPAGVGWGIAVGAGVCLLWIGLTPNPGPPTELVGWRGLGWVVAKVIGYVIVTPLIEELAFRGYLMRRLVDSDFEAVRPGTFTWLSFLGSSAMFGLMHGQWVAGTVAGMAYGLVVVRTGRVRDAMVAHAVTNGLLTVRMAMTGTWAE